MLDLMGFYVGKTSRIGAKSAAVRADKHENAILFRFGFNYNENIKGVFITTWLLGSQFSSNMFFSSMKMELLPEDTD